MVFKNDDNNKLCGLIFYESTDAIQPFFKFGLENTGNHQEIELG